ncbi:MAG: hypothetical protein K6C07_04875 [Bacteroidales bacterium]|nr:hypothetical protein [Bacteroidales bacterium]
MKLFVICSRCGERIPIRDRCGTVDEIREKEGEVFVRTCPYCSAKWHYAYCDVNAVGSLTLWGTVLEWSVFVSLWLASIILSALLLILLPEMAAALVDNGAPKFVELVSLLGFAPIVSVYVICNVKKRSFNRFDESVKAAPFPKMTYRLFDNLYDAELVRWCMRSIPEENCVGTILHYILDFCSSDFIFEDETWKKSSDGEYLVVHAFREIGAMRTAEGLQVLMTENNERICRSEWVEEDEESNRQHGKLWQSFDEIYNTNYGEDINALLVGYLRKNADTFCEVS